MYTIQDLYEVPAYDVSDLLMFVYVKIWNLVEVSEENIVGYIDILRYYILDVFDY